MQDNHAVLESYVIFCPDTRCVNHFFVVPQEACDEKIPTQKLTVLEHTPVNNLSDINH